MSWYKCSQLTIRMGDDVQLMSGGSCAPPVLWISINAVQFFVACCALFFVRLLHSSFDLVRLFPFLFRSSDFSAPLRFLFSARQQFSSLSSRWAFPTAVHRLCMFFRSPKKEEKSQAPQLTQSETSAALHGSAISSKTMNANGVNQKTSQTVSLKCFLKQMDRRSSRHRAK